MLSPSTVLIVFAYRARLDSAVHKRLIIVASTALMTAPIARWHLHQFLRTREFGVGAVMAERLSYIFILLLIAYDLWATRRVHRATLWAGAFLIGLQQFALHFGRTAPWHAFAGWVQHLARSCVASSRLTGKPEVTGPRFSGSCLPTAR